MVSSGRKAGISMVALVITIIVLIVLTSAVVITGVGAPKQAQLAVFKSNVATIQDAVTMKMGNNMITGALEGKDDDYKWLGIVKDYNGTSDIDFTNGEIIVGENVLPLSTDLRSIVKISEEELANYYVSEEGTVYHIGFESNGITYYNNNVAGGTYTMTELWQELSKGTQGVTITISTPQELKDLATYTNEGNTTKGVIFKLMNDITLNENVLNSDGTLNESNIASFEQWIPIGTPPRVYDEITDKMINVDIEEFKTFNGVFDGSGHKIFGVYINQGIVEAQGMFSNNYGIIQKLNLYNSYIQAEGFHTAGIVGNNKGVVENCINAATVSKTIAKYPEIGGIVGYNSGIIKDCTNIGNIIGASRVSGISGKSEGIISNCYNNGNIKGNNHAAGITGQNLRGYVISCSNEGNIESRGEGCGGIVADNRGQIINCYNKGTILGTSNRGGIVGLNYDNAIVINCNNNGELISKSTGYKRIGGIIGKNKGNVYNCYNKGSITGTGDTEVAGLVGKMDTNSAISNSYNLIEISAGINSVGIVDSIDDSTPITINNCYNINNSYFGMTLPTNVTTFNVGLINANGTFPDSQPYTNLVTALNEWVNANKTTYPDLKNWVVLEGEPYPTFQ